MSLAESLLERTAVYALWQAPFASAKLAPLMAHGDVVRARRVLDVGCGPGTNTGIFARTDYLGIDINPRYIEHARRKYNRPFVAADVTSYEFAGDERFDLILVNSFLHHIDDSDMARVLEALRSRLSRDGHIHLLELVLPPNRSIARVLAHWDRGKHARPLADWSNAFSRHFEVVVFEPYTLGLLGATLWNMVYCKGRARA